jgi:hypothetical protein
MSEKVAVRTEAVAKMVRASAQGRALMGGTDAMRDAGEAYLPSFAAEPLETYQSRLKRSVLFEAFPDTVHSMTGRVFAKPVEVTDGPEELKAWADNIDLQGRDLSAFAAQVFEDGFASGVSFIMVDAPRRESEKSQADARAEGLRPYLVHIAIEEVLGWKTQTYGNVVAFSQFRIMESVSIEDPDDEFADEKIAQVRVLDRTDEGVTVRLFRKHDSAGWYVFDEYTTPAKELTIVPYYSRRTGFATGEPPLRGLVSLNIAHWNLQSSMLNNAHYGLIPIMLLTGFDADSEMVLSSNIAFRSADNDADARWVKVDTGAIETTKGLLNNFEAQMQTLGLQVIAEKVKSAAGENRDAAKETSQLSLMADNLKDALENAMSWMSYYGGLSEQVITLDVNKDFGIAPLTYQEAAAMQTDVAMGYLSRETYFEERKRRGVLRPDLDTQAEFDRIASEAPSLTGDGLDLNSADT